MAQPRKQNRDGGGSLSLMFKDQSGRRDRRFMKQLSIICVFAALLSCARAQDVPSPDMFRVLPNSSEGPSITGYLRYQTEMAWQQDAERQKRWEAIKSEGDLLRLQEQLRDHLLKKLGGLPTEKSPLNR